MNAIIKPLVWSLISSERSSNWQADTPFGYIRVSGRASFDGEECTLRVERPWAEEPEWILDVDLVDDLQPNGDPVTFESRLMEARNEAEEEFAAKIRECLA